MALTEIERRLLDGFIWHATITHQASHRVADDTQTFRQCRYKTCRYAADIVAWAESYDIMPSQDEPTKG